MRIITTSAVALSAALLLGLAGTAPSFAKAHDQGLSKGNPDKGPNPNFDGRPGSNAVNETAAAAKSMNDDKGNTGNSGKSDTNSKK